MKDGESWHTSPGLVEIVTREPVMHMNGETLQGTPIGVTDSQRYRYVVDRAAVKVEELKPGTWHVFPTRHGQMLRECNGQG